MNVPNTYASAMASLQVLKLSADRAAGFTIDGPITTPPGFDCECGRPGRRRPTTDGAHIYACDRCVELDGEHPTVRAALLLLEDGQSLSTEDVAAELKLTRLGAYRLLRKLAARGRLRTWLEDKTQPRGERQRQTTELRMWRRAW